ncbi:hypothetical protein [Winogradskyella marina]|nr:hypothetical protein [Winogradskyella marina]
MIILYHHSLLTVLRFGGAAILFWLISIWLPQEKIERKDYNNT